MKETKFTTGASPAKRAAARKAWQTWSAMRAGIPKRPRAKSVALHGIGLNPNSWRNAPKLRDWRLVVKTDDGWSMPDQSGGMLVTLRQLQFLDLVARNGTLDRESMGFIAARMGVQHKRAYECKLQIAEKFEIGSDAELIALAKQLAKKRVSARGERRTGTRQPVAREGAINGAGLEKS